MNVLSNTGDLQMPKFNSVLHYTKGVAAVEIGFPNNDTVCQWCRFCYSEYGLDRARCRLTDEVLRFPFSERGSKCPIVFQEDEHGK